MEDSIVRETVVAAPVERVWEVLTRAEYVGRWFGADSAEIDLRPGGAFVAKVLAGGADASLVAELKRLFASVKHAKPPASRKGSSEWYVVAQGFKGRS